jgi:hypothetical protein
VQYCNGPPEGILLSRLIDGRADSPRGARIFTVFPKTALTPSVGNTSYGSPRGTYALECDPFSSKTQSRNLVVSTPVGSGLIP